VHK
jgi:hypothetical protein